MWIARTFSSSFASVLLVGRSSWYKPSLGWSHRGGMKWRWTEVLLPCHLCGGWPTAVGKPPSPVSPSAICEASAQWLGKKHDGMTYGPIDHQADLLPAKKNVYMAQSVCCDPGDVIGLTFELPQGFAYQAQMHGWSATCNPRKDALDLEFLR